MNASSAAGLIASRFLREQLTDESDYRAGFAYNRAFSLAATHGFRLQRESQRSRAASAQLHGGTYLPQRAALRGGGCAGAVETDAHHRRTEAEGACRGTVELISPGT